MHSRVALRGQLSATPLANLLSTVEASGRSAVVRLVTELGMGTIWVRDGALIDAEIGGARGEAGLGRLVGIEEGRFEVEYVEVVREPRIHASVQQVLQRRAARHQEWGELLSRAPSLNAVLVRNEAPDAPPVPEAMADLIALFDGQRCVIDVIDASGRDAVEVLGEVLDLTDTQVVVPLRSPSLTPGRAQGLQPVAVIPRAPAVPAFEATMIGMLPPPPPVVTEPPPHGRYSSRPGSVERVHSSSPAVRASDPPSTARLGTDPRAVLAEAPEAPPRLAAVPAPPPAPEASTDAVGKAPARFVGRYEVLCRLGRGGMGSVYLARATGEAGFRRLFALKVLRERVATGASAEQVFLHESYIASRLNHPNAVAVLDAAIHSQQPYLVMDYVEGCSLRTLMTRSPEHRPPPLIVSIIADALAGLDAAHELTDDEGHPLRLVHCDVSPDNVLVGIDGWARIADFGVARMGTIGRTPGASNSTRGKAGYVSPEQALGHALDRRSDVFSMGVVLWNALTGRQLFLAPTPEETLRNVVEAEIPPPSEVGLRPPPWLDAICLRALERDPRRRFATARAMADELRRATSHHEAAATPSDVAGWVRAAFGEELQLRRLASLDAARRPRATLPPEPTLPRALTEPPPPPGVATEASDSEPPIPTPRIPADDGMESVALGRLRNVVVILATVAAVAAIGLSVLYPRHVARWFRIDLGSNPYAHDEPPPPTSKPVAAAASSGAPTPSVAGSVSERRLPPGAIPSGEPKDP